MTHFRNIAVTAASLALWLASTTGAAEGPRGQLRRSENASARPDRMLDLPGTGTDPSKIDFFALPELKGQHTIISRGSERWQFRLHEYLAHFEGRFWCIWSHGPVIEDKATQHVRYSTSEDGLAWHEPQVLVGAPKEGYGYIARGLWIRDGELLALASLFEAPGFSGGDLSLEAFRWSRTAMNWRHAGRVQENTLNNFPPKKLPRGRWMMSRRDSERDVSVMIGGTKSISDWQIIPLAAYTATPGQRPEEPYWYLLPDGKRIVGLFRNNSDRKRLLRSFSSDGGRTWTPLRETNFPDVRSKFFSLRTSSGYYVLVSNPNPRGRNPLCLSVSRDGIVFTVMSRLPIPASREDTLQYPHVIEHDGHLLIVFSRNKRAVELVRVPLSEVDQIAGQR